jgi:tripartite-type tricarboxylate transporter receptor subunit TctC
MMRQLKTILLLLKIAILMLLFCGIGKVSATEPYPVKPVRLIVTNPPGGTSDILARALGDELGRSMGQTFLVDNRPGANGNLGAEILIKSPADGYTLLLTPPGPLAINASLYKSLPFDPKTAFAPVSMVAVVPLVLVVNPSLPIKNVAELLAYARSSPGKLSGASQGNGSTGHLALELLKFMTGIDVVHVPYKGSAPALTDLLAGHVQIMFDNTTSSLPHVRRGSLRAIAVAERQRILGAPDIPTLDESGVKGFEATPWFGVVARAGTPEAIVNRLSAEIKTAFQKPTLESRFSALGVELRTLSPEEFARHIRSETEKWDRIIRVSGAHAD